MAEERDIEKQLRAAAEQRRREAGAPFELHPATRRLLQDEVRRAHQRPAAAAERTSLFANWWFRMAAGACVVLLATSIFLPVLSKSKFKGRQLAQNSELREKEIAESVQNRPLSPPPGSAPAPAVSPPSDRDDTDKERLGTTREIVLSGAAAGPSAMVATNAIAPGMATGVPTLALASHSAQPGFYFRNAGVPAGTVWAAGGQIEDRLAKSDLKRSSNDGAKTAVGKGPLAIFQMEQTGSQIRITDSDGSIYNGALIVANPETRATPAEEATAAPGAITAGELDKQPEQPARRNEMLAYKSLAWPQNQNFRFSATGTNLTLNQRIAISGEFIVATNPVAVWETAPGSGGGGGGGGSFAGSAATNSQPLSGGRITGKAVLGNGQEIPLNAVPTTP